MHVEISLHVSFRKMGLQEAEVFIPPHDLCNFENEDMSRSGQPMSGPLSEHSEVILVETATVRYRFRPCCLICQFVVFFLT